MGTVAAMVTVVRLGAAATVAAPEAERAGLVVMVAVMAGVETAAADVAEETAAVATAAAVRVAGARVAAERAEARAAEAAA